VSLGPNNQIPDYSQGIEVPLPLCDKSCKTDHSSAYHIRPIDDPTILNGTKIKLILKHRIKNQTTILFDQEALNKGLVIRYENLDIYPYLHGFIILKWIRKPKGGEIDIHYYQEMEKQGKPKEISLIYIEDPFLAKIIEEEIELKTYFETFFKNYKEYHARVHIVSPANEWMKKVNPADLLFYGAQAYLLYRAIK
jgi:hypothetical protein